MDQITRVGSVGGSAGAVGVVALAAMTSVALSAPAARGTPAAVEVTGASPGRAFVEMFVAGVVPTGEAHTLVLVNADEDVLLPLGIGLPEALSIHGRLERKQTSRPMTHDLLDHIVSKLGGEVVRVQIDDLRDDVYVGTVFIRAGGQLVSFDARPSDAVALALGSRVPIFVARQVVERAALHPDDIVRAPEREVGKAKGQVVLSL